MSDACSTRLSSVMAGADAAGAHRLMELEFDHHDIDLAGDRSFIAGAVPRYGTYCSLCR